MYGAEGPYYISNTPQLPGANLNFTGLLGEPIRIIGHVYAGAGTSVPLPGAKVEAWHADARGLYHPEANGDMSRFHPGDIALRGHVVAGPGGEYEFTSIYPGQYWGRTRHIHVRTSAPGYGEVTTQIIVPPKPGDSMTPENDFVARLLPQENFVTFSEQDEIPTATFDFHLPAG